MAEMAYPRPQLERPQWVSLNGEWKFTFDPEQRFRQPSEVAEWTHTILVPFAPESRASGIGDTGFHRACWYEREFECEKPIEKKPGEKKPGDKKPGRVILHFGAVDYLARVWVNNMLAIEHKGGHTPFVKDACRPLKLSVIARSVGSPVKPCAKY